MTLRAPVVAIAVALAIAACGDEEPPVGACGTLQVGDLVLNTQCGSTLDFIPVNQYQGEIASIQDREDAVALVNGSCTGTLIAAQAGPVVLTAGHCVGLGDTILVAFNIEDAPDGDPLATNGIVIERSDEPDYALIQLDTLPVATPVLLTTQPSDLVAVIQHPRGGRKVIDEGRYAVECEGVIPAGAISYTDLDTLVGSSGAGVLNRQGHLFGVHTDGNCDETGGGANTGWTAATIVDASPYLQPSDIAAR